MTVRKRPVQPVEPPGPSIADLYMEMLGWKPSQRPFYTTANVECGLCREIKPGRDFPQPITPGRTTVCFVCSSTGGSD